MMHRVFMFIAILAAVAVASYQSALGGTIIVTDLQITYAGDIVGLAQTDAASGVLNGDSNNDPDSTPLGTASSSSSWSLNGTGIASASAFAQNSIVFKARASASASFVNPPGSHGVGVAGASASGGEVIVLDLRGSAIDAPSSIVAYFTLDGRLSVSAATQARAIANVNWRVTDQGGFGGAGFSAALDSSAANPDFESVSQLQSATLSAGTHRWVLPDGTTTAVQQSGRPDFAVLIFTESLSVNAQAVGGPSSATADFGNSAELTALLLPDGSTPESHGIDLYFLSGRTSPNLSPAAVPEPASLTILGVLGLGCTIAAKRRRKSATTV
jgi:hypothetical protein